MWGLFCAAASAATVAVLPLERAQAPVELEGLGRGLASMMVADLAGAPGIVLVERMRVDDLLAELALAERSFLDPSTAARAGLAVGAEYVLVGSFSVMDPNLTVDVRLVNVTSGEVVEGAVATGPVTDFVSVEKEVVRRVLVELGTDLDARSERQLLSRVVTEDWDAFVAWSRGLSEAHRGQFDAARRSYDEALARDPAFVEAAASRQALEAILLARTAEQATLADRERRAIADQVLAGSVDPRSHGAGPWATADLATLPARWAVLAEQGRWCDRAAEMSAVLTQLDWRIVPDPRFEDIASGRASALGWKVSDRRGADAAVQVNRPQRIFRNLHAYLYDDLLGARDGSIGFATSVARCEGANAAMAALDRWEKELLRQGRLDEEAPYLGIPYSHRDGLIIARAWLEAGGGAVSPPTRARLDARIDAVPVASTKKREALLDVVRRLSERAERERLWSTAPLGVPLDLLRKRVVGLATGQAPYRSDGAPWCSVAHTYTWRVSAQQADKSWATAESRGERPDAGVVSAGPFVRAAMDMGCFEDAPARFTTLDALKQYVFDTVGKVPPTETRPICTTSLSRIRLTTPSDGLSAASILQDANTLLVYGCTSP